MLTTAVLLVALAASPASVPPSGTLLHSVSAAQPTEAAEAPSVEIPILDRTKGPIIQDKKATKREFETFTLESFIENLRAKRNFAVFSYKRGRAENLLQEPALAIIMQDPALRDFGFYKLDMMAQPEDAEKLYMSKPSMILIFRNGKEVSRTTRVIEPERLSKLLLPQVNSQGNGQLPIE